jgi:hypothetical protein
LVQLIELVNYQLQLQSRNALAGKKEKKKMTAPQALRQWLPSTGVNTQCKRLKVTKRLVFLLDEEE